MNIQELMTTQRLRNEPLEIFVDGQWKRAVMLSACYEGFDYNVGGHAEFRLWHDRGGGLCWGGSETYTIAAKDIPTRVRLPLEGRNLTAAEIDSYCDGAKHQVAIGVAELNALARTAKAGLDALAELKALARTAKAGLDALAELEKLRAQLKSVQEDRDAYKEQALDRARILAEVGEALRTTGEYRPGTKFVDAIKSVDALRRNAESGYNLVAGHLRDRTAKLNEVEAALGLEKNARVQFKRSIAHALGMVWLRADHEPKEAEVHEKAKVTRPPMFFFRQPISYQREIDELKKQNDALDAALAEAEKQRETASKTARAAGEDSIKLQDRLTEITASMSDANAKLRAELANWRSKIPVEAFELLEKVLDGHRAHAPSVNHVWAAMLNRWIAWLEHTKKLLRGDS